MSKNKKNAKDSSKIKKHVVSAKDSKKLKNFKESKKKIHVSAPKVAAKAKKVEPVKKQVVKTHAHEVKKAEIKKGSDATRHIKPNKAVKSEKVDKVVKIEKAEKTSSQQEVNLKGKVPNTKSREKEKDKDKSKETDKDKLQDELLEETEDYSSDELSEYQSELDTVVNESEEDDSTWPVAEVPVVTSVVSSKSKSEEVVLTDADGRRYCRVRDCDQIAMVDSYCRYHYLLLWKKIQIRKKILADGKLERYVEELTSRYPDKFLEVIRRDLRSEKDFIAAIQELEIDESNVENDFEDESSNYIEEVRSASSDAGLSDDEEF